MITQIKEIKEIIPETLDYILMDENELYAQGEKIGELFETALREKKNGKEMSDELKKNLLAGIQYGVLYSTLMNLKMKDKKYYNRLMQDLQAKKENAELDIDYLEKISSGCFMKSIKASYEWFNKMITPSASE
ncbi:MAG TPA: hypothetical protein VJ461_04420 [Candidatus Nanoarchaeia archaeon]|nr:hypothetical protein [Candidatus Nanoarchaeia archaeon]